MRLSSVVTTLTLALGTSLAARAQSPTVQVGPKAGLTLAVLSGQINRSAEFKTGLAIGGFLRWRPSERIALQPELVFSQQGANNTVNYGGMTAESKVSLNYLNIPVLLKIYLGNVVNLQVGPQLGLLFSARRVGQDGYFSGSGGSGFTTEDTDVKADYKNDFALCAGLGVDLPSGLVASARVNYGLTDIDNNEVSIASRRFFGIGGLHNRTIEFSVGYALGSKK